MFLSQVLSRGEEIRCVCIFIEIARQEGSTENLLVIVTKRNLKFHTQCWCFFVFVFFGYIFICFGDACKTPPLKDKHLHLANHKCLSFKGGASDV